MSNTTLLEQIVVPVASVEDARTTARALVPLLRDTTGHVILVNVIEKAGGAPDKASVEQRETHARDMFDAATHLLEDAGISTETQIRYGTDIVETIEQTALEHDATAIVFSPRGGSRWIQLLTGDVALRLLQEASLPVIALHDSDDPERDEDG